MKTKWLSLLAVVSLLATMFGVLPVVASAETTPQVIVSNGVLSEDWSVYEVEVSLANNPGIIFMCLEVDYDSENLELVGVEDAGKLGTQYHTDHYADPYYLHWNNPDVTENYTVNGVVATLQFRLIGEAGDYPITVSAGTNDIGNTYMDPVSFEMVSGTVSACDHANKNVDTTEATCTKDGSIVTTCPDCNAIKTEVIESVGSHDWSDWEIKKAATTKNEGYKERTCSACGEIDGEVIPMLTLDTPYAEFSDETAATRHVTAALTLHNNPGVSSMKFLLSYDTEYMTLFDVANAGAFSSVEIDSLASHPCTITLNNDTDVTDDVTVAYVTFELKDNAPETVTYALEAVEAKNAASATVDFAGVGGQITVPDSIRHTVTITDAVGGTGTADRSVYYYGDKATLTATVGENEFSYWMVGNRSYVTQTVTVTVSSDITATPVFVVESSGEQVYTVKFFTADGRLYKTMTTAEIEAAGKLPDVPLKYGYIANGWQNVIMGEITDHTDAKPTYLKDSNLVFDVTTTNGQIEKPDDAPNFDDRITVTSTDPNFSVWVDGDDHVVSVLSTYTFYASQDVTLTAKTKSEKAAPPYFININKTSGNMEMEDTTKYRMSLIADTYVDTTQYTIVERGVIYIASAVENADDLQIGASSAVKQKVATTATNGQFMYSLKNAPKGTTVTARAYMILKDKQGNVIPVYSDGLCDASWIEQEWNEDDYIHEDEGDF